MGRFTDKQIAIFSEIASKRRQMDECKSNIRHGLELVTEKTKELNTLKLEIEKLMHKNNIKEVFEIE